MDEKIKDFCAAIVTEVMKDDNDQKKKIVKTCK